MKKPADVFQRVEAILEIARSGIARTVNTTLVVANWLVGREIVEEEQKGRKKAAYGQDLIRTLAKRLQGNFGGGYAETNIKLFRQFYLTYPDLLDCQIGHTLCDQFRLSSSSSPASVRIRHTACDESRGLPANSTQISRGRSTAILSR